MNRISEEFGERITTFFVKKDFENNTIGNIVKIEHGMAKIDDYIKEYYTKENLEKCL